MSTWGGEDGRMAGGAGGGSENGEETIEGMLRGGAETAVGAPW